MIPVHEVEAILITGGLLVLACCAMCYVHGRGDRRRLKALRTVWRAELRGEIEQKVRAAYDTDLIKARADRTRAQMDAERARTEAANAHDVAGLLQDETHLLGSRLADVGALADDYDRCPYVLQGPSVAARIRRTLQAAGQEASR